VHCRVANVYLARGWSVNAGDDINEGGFAAAGFANNGRKLASPYP
jgi:hypothetical protein